MERLPVYTGGGRQGRDGALAQGPQVTWLPLMRAVMQGYTDAALQGVAGAAISFTGQGMQRVGVAIRH